jgi:hypothetical protein
MRALKIGNGGLVQYPHPLAALPATTFHRCAHAPGLFIKFEYARGGQQLPICSFQIHSRFVAFPKRARHVA